MASSNTQLPGVFIAGDTPIILWPPSKLPTMSGSSVNTGAYLAARNALFLRYALPWLSDLHAQDVQLYQSLLFDLTTALAEEASFKSCSCASNPFNSQTLERQHMYPILNVCLYISSMYLSTSSCTAHWCGVRSSWMFP